MDESRFKKAHSILESVIDLPPREREEAIEQACAEDAGLLKQLTEMLRLAEAVDDAFLAVPVIRLEGEQTADRTSTLRQIGPYQLIRLIGEGGMGAVYEARQESPRRSVAVKVLRTGLFSADAVKRFERESQVLGLLHHPGIAQIYEAGTAQTAIGELPFFAMELVRGESLLGYVQGKRLAVPETLELIAKVCDAAEHAHRHGIVHRDLKPANILIEESDRFEPGGEGPEGAGNRPAEVARGVAAPSRCAQPKILDFGVARAANPEMQLTLQTGQGQIVGTLAYMSPEQVQGEPDRIDARTDVYSLGVVAYEALSGRLPLDVRGRTVPDVARAIVNDEPTRLRSLDSRLSGDIDTIIAKAMEKDPGRRYQSAAEFAADIRRCLRDEPIDARPASSLYQLRKFAKRNRTLVSGVMATIAALSIGVATTTYWALRAGERRVEAEETAAEALRQAYTGSIAAAQAALEGGDAQRARLSLDRAPEALRGWEWTYLDHLSDRSTETIRFGEGFPTSVIDGDYIFLIGPQRRPTVLNWRTGWRVECDSPGVDGASAFSMNGPADRFLVCGYMNTALFDARTGRTIRIFDDSGRFECDPFFPDGKTFVLAQVAPKRLVYYESETGKELRSVPIAGVRRSFPTVSPDGALVAIETTEGQVGVFDATTDEMVWQAPGVVPRFSPDGSRVLVFDPTLSAATKLVIRSRASGDRIGELDLSDSAFSVTGGTSRIVGMSRDQRRLGVVQNHGGVRIVDADTFRPLMILNGMRPWISLPSSGISFSTDGTKMAVAGEPDSMKVWDAQVSANPYQCQGNYGLVFFAADISPDSRFTATGDWGQVAVWDASNGRPVWAKFHALEFVTAVRFSPDGSRIAVCSDRGAVRLLDAATGEQLRESFPRGFGAFGSDWASGAAWRADGKSLLVTVGQRELLELDPQTLDVITTRQPGPGTLSGLTVSSDGRFAAAIVRTGEESLVLWDLETGEAPRVVPVAEPLSVAWSADGRMLGLGTRRGVHLVDPATGRMSAVNASAGSYTAVAFTPDSTRLVGAAHDHGVCIWSVDRGDLVCVLPARPSGALCLRFAADGASLTGVNGYDSVYRFETQAASSEVYARRESERQGRDLVNSLRGEGQLSEEIEKRIRSAGGVTDAVRDAAISINGVLGDQVAELNNAVFIEIGKRKNRESALRALRISEVVVRRTGDPYARNVHGIALFRLGRYQEALAELDAAKAGYDRTRTFAEGMPVMLVAFRAMCLEKVGEREKGAELLRQLMEASRSLRDGGSDLEKLFIEEAVACFQPPGTAPSDQREEPAGQGPENKSD